MKVTPFIILAAFLSFSTLVIADEDEIPSFKKADVDGNKFVDEKEFEKAKKAGVKKSLSELDKDEDGKLNKEEYSIILEEDCA